MKRNLKILPLLAAPLFLISGCSAGSDYWRNRWDDACDIVTAGVGLGFGAKAYAFGVQVDLYNYGPLAEIRGGEAFVARKHSEEYHVEEGNIGVPMLGANMEIFYPGGRAVERGKAYCGLTPLLPLFVLDTRENNKKYCNSCAWHEKRARLYRKKTLDEDKEKTEQLESQVKSELGETAEFGGKSRLKFQRPAWCVYTDVNVVAAPVLGARIGFNIGEFADFLLGWFGLDIFGDDL